MKVGLDRWPRFLADASRRAEAAGSDDGAGHYQVAQRERPGVMSDASPPHRPTTPAEHLTEAAKAAYDSYSRDCSHAVWAVLKDVVNPDEPYRTANEPMAHVARPGSGWRQVTSLQEASDLANAGKVVVGGLAVPRGNGHVLIVMPGPMQPAGGFGGIHRTEILYPPSMSGSLSGWQGAMSRGQRTVRDAWSNDDWKGVTFWVHK
jgi:hypothetical protein